MGRHPPVLLHLLTTDIAPTTEKLKQHLRAAPTAKQQAVIKKYSAAKYMAVTALPDVKKFMAAR